MTECPLCGNGQSVSVYAGSPFFRCLRCGIVFNTAHSPLSYSDSYFTDEYRAQYGRTYEEDFYNITRASRIRVKHIRKLWNEAHLVSPHSLLDIGSALGFFLKAASDEGFTRVEGLEISDFAANYCRKRFGFSVIDKSFESAELTRKYDVITAWYFLEHCADTQGALRKITMALNDGGIFAFSAPSTFGALYLFSRKKWVDTHPVDHRIDFSPRTVRRTLKALGFKKIIVRAAGIHPERVMSRRNPLYFIFAPLYRSFSRRFAFSDTIEVYAIK
ncbi:MAG TPA: class I SAM-dependent methyltransferase [Spirochaetota bacterium]